MFNIPNGLSILHAFPVGFVDSFAWSPDGRFLAMSSRSIIRLWDPQTEAMLTNPEFSGHTSNVFSLSWSPDGKYLASGSLDGTACIWETNSGNLVTLLGGEGPRPVNVAWSPDGRFLAMSSRSIIRLWDPQTEAMLTNPEFSDHRQVVTHLVWSPDSRHLASASADKTVRIWDIDSAQATSVLSQDTESIHSISWSRDGRLLAIGLREGIVRVWDLSERAEIRRIEGMVAPIRSLTFSHDGRLLAFHSVQVFNTVFIRRTDTWEEVGQVHVSSDNVALLAFHPSVPVLITPGSSAQNIRIWDVDVKTLLGNVSTTHSLQYSNAKVVLLGDSGVGKTGLALALSSQSFRPTESTHGRHVWPFSSELITLDERRKELRETFLWDLAGQPNYRLIHQLHLDEVAVALVVFDGKAERAPFEGVYHWDRALRQAQSVQGIGVPPIRKILVAARIDRGGIPVSRKQIKALVDELDFHGFVETSAKEHYNISALMSIIAENINWQTLPKLSSTDLFQAIKLHLAKEKASGRVLGTLDDLYRGFLQSGIVEGSDEVLRTQFETCVLLMESRDLIQRLKFGSFVLLQPELLDAYASALINAVGREPDGLGSMPEDRIKSGDFDIPEDERIKDPETETLLILAMIENLLRRDIALREHTSGGTYLVFPSQTTREAPDLLQPEGPTVTFDFMGSIRSIYSTLAVRLSFSELFSKRELWKDAVSYTAEAGGVCGLSLESVRDGLGELTLFFDKDASSDTRTFFIRYVERHLIRNSVLGSVSRRPSKVFCPRCHEMMTSSMVKRRLEFNLTFMKCPVCDENIDLLDQDQRLASTTLRPKIDSTIRAMDNAADVQRRIETLAIINEGKVETKRMAGEFDVFLCHNVHDKQEVKDIAQQLLSEGILPWLDEWELPPGQPFARLLEDQIGRIRSAAVFVGHNSIGPWQHMELEAFLREFARRNVPVIPVILKTASATPELPIFLKGMTWVDFRKDEPNPLHQLIWGITRQHPGSEAGT